MARTKTPYTRKHYQAAHKHCARIYIELGRKHLELPGGTHDTVIINRVDRRKIEVQMSEAESVFASKPFNSLPFLFFFFFFASTDFSSEQSRIERNETSSVQYDSLEKRY